MNINLEKKKNIKKAIVLEYLLIIVSIIIIIIGYSPLFDYLIGDNTGLDGIGQALGIVIIFRIIMYVVVLAICVINPIRIFIVYKNNFKEMHSIPKKFISILLVFLPILFSLIVFFEVPISNYIYNKKYNTGENEYTVSPQNYKLPSNFYNELRNRGLTYNNDTEILSSKLNSDHDCQNYRHINNTPISQRCYEKSTIFGINSNYYYDSIDGTNITNNNNSFPVYIYNAILTLPSEDEDLQYAALGRYSYNSDDYGQYKSEFNDYYIECKILYVDGDIYAILGLGESYDIRRYFNDNNKNKNWFDNNNPYNMIISEKNTITTYYNNKYYPNGAIENVWQKYEMVPNTNTKEWVSNYPVRKVDKLDIHTINSIAKELQQGVLKDSIKYHFTKRTQ